MNDQPANKPYPFPAIAAVLWMIGLTAIIAAAVTGVLTKLGHSEHIELNFIAAGVCLAAGVLAVGPVYLLSRKSFSAAAYGFLVGILIRMAFCGAFVVIAKNVQIDPSGKLPFWIACWYLVLLFVEVLLMSRYIQAFNRSTATLTTAAAVAGLYAENAV